VARRVPYITDVELITIQYRGGVAESESRQYDFFPSAFQVYAVVQNRNLPQSDQIDGNLADSRVFLIMDVSGKTFPFYTVPNVGIRSSEQSTDFPAFPHSIHLKDVQICSSTNLQKKR